MSRGCLAAITEAGNVKMQRMCVPRSHEFHSDHNRTFPIYSKVIGKIRIHKHVHTQTHAHTYVKAIHIHTHAQAYIALDSGKRVFLITVFEGGET
jgi:hypothetical protein